MWQFKATHIALFDELERQGVFGVDLARLTEAVLQVDRAVLLPYPSNPRCANGACED